MSRIRTIKPEFWTDEKIVQLPFEARLLFIGMWNFADDEGLLSNEPDRLRLQILPNDTVDTELFIDLLHASGLVEIIDAIDGSSILKIHNFNKHQKISHATPTKFASGKKRARSVEARRQVAIKYGCNPGEQVEAGCYYCGAQGTVCWFKLSNGRPSYWVCFSGLEIDHFIPENSGGTEANENLVLSCRHCNRTKGSSDPLQFAIAAGGFGNPPENSRELRRLQVVRRKTPEDTGSL